MIINKKDKIIIAVTIIIVIVLSVILVFNIIKVLKYKEGHPKDIIYIIDIKDSNNFEVILKENSFINNIEANNNLSYITSLIDYINSSFRYEYQGSKGVRTDYEYYVKANIISEYRDDNNRLTLKPIWNKELILIDKKKGYTEDSKVLVIEEFKIGIEYYNNLVNQFKTELNIPTKSTLEIKFIINTTARLKKNINIKKEHYMLMSIPLDVTAFDITTSKNFFEQEITYNKEQRKTEISYLIAIIYIIIIIVVDYIGIYIINYILDRKKSKYMLEKNKILKNYNNRIVTVTNLINYSDFEIFDVTDFKELIDFANEAYEPIIFWEKKDRRNREAWFVIIRDKILYRYIIYKNIIKSQK